jgi:hypothetical protein
MNARAIRMSLSATALFIGAAVEVTPTMKHEEIEETQ